MLMDRNYTSHIYSENLAIDICRNIKTQYVFELEKLKKKILERKENIDKNLGKNYPDFY